MTANLMIDLTFTELCGFTSVEKSLLIMDFDHSYIAVCN